MSDPSTTLFYRDFSKLTELPDVVAPGPDASVAEVANYLLQTKLLLRIRSIAQQRAQARAELESVVRRAFEERACSTPGATGASATGLAATPRDNTDDFST